MQRPLAPLSRHYLPAAIRNEEEMPRKTIIQPPVSQPVMSRTVWRSASPDTTRGMDAIRSAPKDTPDTVGVPRRPAYGMATPRTANGVSSRSLATISLLFIATMLTTGVHAAPYTPCYPSGTPVTAPIGVFNANIGTDGKPGTDADLDGPGHNGVIGTAGSDFSLVQTARAFGITLFSQGGKGGDGSNASGGSEDTSLGGGIGVAGGAGGTMMITVNAPVSGPLASASGPSAAVCAASIGGQGSAAGLPDNSGPRHAAGMGGGSGPVIVTVNAIVISGVVGVIAEAVGGQGGNGKSGSSDIGVSHDGGAGGPGAPGGPVVVTVAGVVNAGFTSSVAIDGVDALSFGGNGGTGGDGFNNTGGYKGGSGGDAGAGGDVTVALTGSITTASSGMAPGILATSSGGLGGAGGTTGNGGTGGSGADGGTVAVTLNGQIITQSNDSPGVIAQSLGGQGAVGGKGNAWTAPVGGAGGSGGNGGPVSILGSGGSISTGSFAPASNANGIVAQSIGGGGGSGGDAAGDFTEIGGGGGVAANGGMVTLNISDLIKTAGDRSNGVLAQSIGGGGGNGGNSTGTGPTFNLTIGGSGAGGGSGGAINAFNGGTIQTDGDHSAGMVLQSIGGGGGNGGAAYGTAKDGVIPIISVQVSLGGTAAGGGGGGPIGLVSGETTTNGGAISTRGPDSAGILAQSIGGGGGTGGASGGEASASAGPTTPGLGIIISTGGSGGDGEPGGTITVGNAGLIATGGAGSRGLVAESIGGGGGDAGIDDATSAAAFNQQSININIRHGGTAGPGGSGGTIGQEANSGLIVTTGADADAMLAQSVGGGGGTGGAGDGASVSGTISATVLLGATGGNGGGGGTSTASNTGGILTLGDGAAGIIAQSVGGGGGRAGGAAGSAGTGTFSATLLLGASGGKAGGSSAGTNNVVTVTNAAPILTFGADATGIIAQSVGGGGGIGGTAASSIGGAKSTGDGGNGKGTAGPVLAALVTAGAPAVSNYMTLPELVGLANSLLGNPVDNTFDVTSQVVNLAASGGQIVDSGSSTSVTLKVVLGASGGGGGSAGVVGVTNSSQITTTGSMSDGILAQSVGGGGGKGGAANAALTAGAVKSSLALGATAGLSGDGGAVTVTNTTGAAILTIGGAAPGIVAQSIGGGGGEGGLSGASTGALKSTALSLGASGGASGDAGAVTVDNEGEIKTMSHDSPGIVAQSIGGGGGLVKTLATNQDQGGGPVPDPGSYQVGFSFTGNTTSASAGGNSTSVVFVKNEGAIITTGRNAYGIVAQSIGGGGGLILGGQPQTQNNANSFFGDGSTRGDGSSVIIDMGGVISTSGQGAIGIVAQSIGGGGGFGGDTGQTEQLFGFAPNGVHTGNGSGVSIVVEQAGAVQTNALNTPAILAQSIGGGGGRITTNTGAYNGWSGSQAASGGSGNGGQVLVDVFGTVRAFGAASPGIYAQSAGVGGAGTPGSVIHIMVGSTGYVSGGTPFNTPDVSPGIYVDSGSTNPQAPNTISNAGTITSATGVNGTAIYNSVGYLAVTNNSGGVIIGNISLDNAGGSGTPSPITGAPAGGGSLVNSGVIQAGTSIRLGAGGTLTNLGTIDIGGGNIGGGNIGGTAIIANTAMTGNLVQGSTGQLVFNPDFANGKAPLLTIQGSANIAGSVQVVPSSVANHAVTVLTATDGLSLQPGVSSTRTYLFNFDTSAVGNSLQVQPRADFQALSGVLGGNQSQVASQLQTLWNSGANLGGGFGALATINDRATYAQSLNSLSGQTLGAVAAFRFSSSHNFVANMFGGCGTVGSTSGETDCAWSRIVASHTDQNSTTDALGYQANAQTYQFGIDRSIAPNWTLGGSLAYESSQFQTSGISSRMDGNTALAGVDLRYRSGPWLVAGAIDLGYGSYSSARFIDVGSVDGTAIASPGLLQAGVHSRVAYTLPLGSWYVQPFVDFHANYLRSGAYTETGNTPFNLAVDAEGSTTLAASAALEVGTGIALRGDAMLRLYANGGISVLGNSEWAATARFANQFGSGSSFRASTPLPNTLAKLNVGAEIFSSAEWDFRLQYSADVGGQYMSQSGLGRLAWHF
jgi:hypothetical protein